MNITMVLIRCGSFATHHPCIKLLLHSTVRKGVTIYETHSVHGGMKLRINPTNTVFTEPTEALQVDGNAIISGVIDAASFRGSLVADDSTTIVDAINSTITVGSFVQFGSMTTAARNAITAANGMVIYNTTLNKFQGFWVRV